MRDPSAIDLIASTYMHGSVIQYNVVVQVTLPTCIKIGYVCVYRLIG